MTTIETLLSTETEKKVQERYSKLHWTGTFDEYIDIIIKNPNVTRNAFQRVYDMIVSHGQEEVRDGRETLTRYHFFDDPMGQGRDAIYGLDRSLAELVKKIEGGAKGYGNEKRLLLLHGPVGSAKSTIACLLKKGLEEYSRTDEGALYTFDWVLPNPRDKNKNIYIRNQLNNEPLLLIPEILREEFLKNLNARIKVDHPWPVTITGLLSPDSRRTFSLLMEQYDGNLNKVLTDHVRVRRMIISEEDRIGIGTFQPKDDKNQDATELTGDLNYRKIAEIGDDSDPRVIDFNGEFCVANRGVFEVVEILKLEVAFLYDFLGATQEHRIKLKKMPQTHIDEVIIGHTNEPEFKRLQSNDRMEAFRDRTVRIDIPYVLNLSDEVKIYDRDYTAARVKKHIAPHAKEIAAFWALLTRLKESAQGITLSEKVKLYDGMRIPGWTDDMVEEERKRSEGEGHEGVSPRFIQDQISAALVNHPEAPCLNPFMVIKALDDGLDNHSLISNEEDRERYRNLLSEARLFYEDIVKSEVRRMVAGDDNALENLCSNYVDNVKAYTQKEKLRNQYTGQHEEPNERLMRSIEEKINIAESRKDDFRREIMNFIGACAVEGKPFSWQKNERLSKAFEEKLFEDSKATMKLATSASGLLDKEAQEKIDILKKRMKDRLGYCDHCGTDVLSYVSSIFARGDSKSK